LELHHFGLLLRTMPCSWLVGDAKPRRKNNYSAPIVCKRKKKKKKLRVSCTS
jgi:hypothetical protein